MSLNDSNSFGDDPFFIAVIMLFIKNCKKPHKGCKIIMLDQMKALAREKNMCVLATEPTARRIGPMSLGVPPSSQNGIAQGRRQDVF